MIVGVKRVRIKHASYDRNRTEYQLRSVNGSQHKIEYRKRYYSYYAHDDYFFLGY